MKSLFTKLMVVSCLALSSVAVTACSNDDGGTDATNGKTISDLDISGDNTVDNGNSKQLTATLKYADGTTLNVTSDSNLLWNTSDADVLTVSTSGLMTGKKVGGAKVTATYNNGGQATADIDVLVH